MAALVAGVQYGLSSQGNFHDNKSLIFVKLTDSALRSIEEYIRNKNKISQQPTIQFLGNGGHLSFPSTQSGHGHSFNFSLSSNADIEGPQGSFECIQQTESRSLESLGTLNCKMRIQAKDDVYEATKNRMAIVEEEQKKNCTRVIKASGPDIGKKIKVKKPGLNLPKRETSPPYHHSVSKLNPPKSAPSSQYSQPNDIVVNGSKRNVSNHHLSKPSNNHKNQKQGNPDLMKRPVRDRLIHLLALRPFKKPELIERMQRDGIRESDKKCLMVILKQVSYMRDNSYHLAHHLWNDVQEDWPFYNEQERQTLKRRKPQNLTPPGSDASSGSGQSPTSTHPGSPPTTISSSASKFSPIGGGNNLKRPGYTETVDGLQTKKQRISHFRKTADNSVTGRPDSSQSLQRPDSRSSSPYNSLVSSANVDKEDHTNQSVFDFTSSSVSTSMASSDNFSNGYSLNNNFNGVSDRRSVKDANKESDKYSVNLSRRKHEFGLVSSKSENSGVNNARKPEPNGVLSQSISHGHGGHHDNRNRCYNNRVSSSSNKVHTPGSSPDTQVENIDSEDKTVTSTSEYPEYLTSYTTIQTAEQRRRYKADFNAHYSEYRNLHAVVERVSRKFAQLEERLRQEEQGTIGWKEIKDQIVKEYKDNKKDLLFQEAKRRFQYLHEKLSHIKRLVLEYDSAQTSAY